MLSGMGIRRFGDTRASTALGQELLPLWGTGLRRFPDTGASVADLQCYFLYIILRLTCSLLDFPHFMSQMLNLLLWLIAFVSRSSLFALEWCPWLGHMQLLWLGLCSARGREQYLREHEDTAMSQQLWRSGGLRRPLNRSHHRLAEIGASAALGQGPLPLWRRGHAALGKLGLLEESSTALATLEPSPQWG